MPLDYDAALKQVHTRDMEYSIRGFAGLSTHAPMALEALVELGGLEQAAPAYLSAWMHRLLPVPDGFRSAEAVGVEAALGRYELRAAALATWRERLRERPWQEVVEEAVQRLGPGVMAGALHGWLRTAHAVRALRRDVTPQRLDELAWGLAYWTARYLPVPGSPASRPRPGTTVQEVIAALPRVPPPPQAGLIWERVAALQDHAAFARVTRSWDPSCQDLDDTLGALAHLTAARLLAQPRHRIVFVHVLTGSSALRLIEPVVSPPVLQSLARHVVHAAFALFALHDDHQPPGPWEPPSPAALHQLALTTQDDHVIKGIEAALREHDHRPDPRLLAAVEALAG